MAVKVGATEVIDDSRVFKNLTGVEGNYSHFQPSYTTQTIGGSVFNLSKTKTTYFITLNGTWTCQYINSAAAGDQITVFVDTSTNLEDISFTNVTNMSTWHFVNDTEPTWTDARYWQIVITCFSPTDHMVSATSWGNIPGTADVSQSITAGSISFGTQVGIHHQSPSGSGYTKTYNGTGGNVYGYSVTLDEASANIDNDYHFCDLSSSLIITGTSNTGDQLSTFGYSDSTGWPWRHWGRGSNIDTEITPNNATYTHVEAGLNVDSTSPLGSLGSWNGEFTSNGGTVWKVLQILWAKNTRTSGTFPSLSPYNGSGVSSGDGGNFVTIGLRRLSGSTAANTDDGMFKTWKIGGLTLSRSDASVAGNGNDWSICWNGGTTGGMTDYSLQYGAGESTGSKTIEIYLT